MTRTRKWLLGTGITLGVLVVLLAAALAWLVYTPSGLRFALDRGTALTHGHFTYANASGTLAGTATVTRIQYRDASGDDLRIQRATIALQPWALLGRRLHVRHARIDGITLELAPPTASAKSALFSLKPPLTVDLEDTQVTHIAVELAGKPLFAADDLTIAGLWSNRRLVLRQLALRAPAGNVQLEGTLAIARGYRGGGHATFDWMHADTRYAGSVTSKSDGKTAKLDAALTWPMPLQLTLKIGLNNKHAWTLALAAPRFNARALPALPASLHTLALNLHGAGDAHGGKLKGTLAANGHVVLIDPAQFRYDGKTLTLDPLRLHSPAMPGVASATGVVHLDTTPMTAALDLNWRDVQLPADLAGQPLATHGDVHVEGSAERFALKGALAIGPPGKLSNLQVDLVGTPQAIQLNALKLVQKDGGLDAHGSVELQPRITWKLDAVANKFDPGAILAGWNGALDFTLATQGTITPKGPEATLKLDHAGGNLRGRSITGSNVDLKIAPGNLLDGSLLLVAGNSRIRAQGTGGTRTDATLELDVASLGDWLPDATGQLTGRFTVKGIWPKFGVAGQLHGKALREGTRRVDALQLTASIPDLSQPGGKLDLALSGVHAAGLDFNAVHLQGSGTAAAQHLALTATGKSLSATLALRGSWQPSTRRWTGTLSNVELAPAGMPMWRQQQPSMLTWHDGAATLSELCLTAGAPQLCLSAARDARGAITAKYALQRLPLQLLTSLASGSRSLQASGDFSGSGEVKLDANNALTGHATLTASAGKLAFAATAGQPLVAWSGITVDASAKGSNQHVSLRGALTDGGHIRGDVTLEGTQHALAGTLDVDLRSLAMLEAVSPEIANARGYVAGTLTLAGTLAAPQFSGSIQARDFSAELPRAGLKLHAGQFAVSGDPQGRLTLHGQITSDTGVLHVNGSTGLAANAPLSLAIQGSNVLVADIPAARVVASPDLHIARAAGVFAVTGSVTIPTANVAIAKLPGQGPTQASKDVIIVDAPPAATVTPMAMTATVEVKLGNDVKVQGYGLDGTVHGQLAVNVQPGRTATGRGEIRIKGKYQAYGQNLTIERGRLLFAGTRLDDPGLDIRAVRSIRSQDITVGLAIRGTAQRPVLSVFSDPSMEQAEALSYLVTGRPLDALKSGEGDTLNTAAQALGGLAGDRLAKSLGSRLGLEAGVSSSEALGGSAFTAGKYLSPRLFLSYGVGLFTPGQVITLRYTLNRFLQFEAENATTGNRASLNYKIEK